MTDGQSGSVGRPATGSAMKTATVGPRWRLIGLPGRGLLRNERASWTRRELPARRFSNSLVLPKSSIRCRMRVLIQPPLTSNRGARLSHASVTRSSSSTGSMASSRTSTMGYPLKCGVVNHTSGAVALSHVPGRSRVFGRLWQAQGVPAYVVPRTHRLTVVPAVAACVGPCLSRGSWPSPPSPGLLVCHERREGPDHVGEVS